MTLTRRELLLLGASLPGFDGLVRALPAGRPDAPLPHAPAAGDEAAWERIKQEFLVDGLHLNTGTYGASPIAVIEATVRHLRAWERIIGQEHFDDAALHRDLETFLGAWPGSVAIVRNTTEAMNIAAAGLDFTPGDEVLSTTHEHIGGRCCWEMLAKRRGVVYRTFDPELDPRSEAELAAKWMEQVTPRTRVLSISHALFTTGMIQPVQALVKMARERGIVTVIDGAHAPGMLATDVRDIDADFYATSAHKWLLAPKGTGMLIVRPDRIATTWPLVASGGWDATTASRFEHGGTRNESLVAGMVAALAFHQAIGRAAVEARVRYLATGLHDALRQVPRVRIVSPSRAPFRSGMVSFTMDGISAEALQGYLGRERIRTRRVAEFGLEYLRLSTGCYVLPRDLERVATLLRSAPRTG